MVSGHHMYRTLPLHLRPISIFHASLLGVLLLLLSVSTPCHGDLRGCGPDSNQFDNCCHPGGICVSSGDGSLSCAASPNPPDKSTNGNVCALERGGLGKCADEKCVATTTAAPATTIASSNNNNNGGAGGAGNTAAATDSSGLTSSSNGGISTTTIILAAVCAVLGLAIVVGAALFVKRQQSRRDAYALEAIEPEVADAYRGERMPAAMYDVIDKENDSQYVQEALAQLPLSTGV